MKVKHEVEDCFREIAPELQKIRNTLFNYGMRSLNINIQTDYGAGGMFTTDEKSGMWAGYHFRTDGYTMRDYNAKLYPPEICA